eukprot:5012224-Amphidinium_carterae.11
MFQFLFSRKVLLAQCFTHVTQLNCYRNNLVSLPYAARVARRLVTGAYLCNWPSGELKGFALQLLSLKYALAVSPWPSEHPLHNLLEYSFTVSQPLVLQPVHFGLHNRLNLALLVLLPPEGYDASFGFELLVSHMLHHLTLVTSSIEQHSDALVFPLVNCDLFTCSSCH